ncbi:MAG: CopG family transcriptional regulator [Rhizobiales bacterium]|mgnify:CR=1 FL=1|nr:CopG family transcriptional regulator [Hyphomicrobiales bacterium]
MKNVTITLDEKVAHWARVEAAKAGKSLSRWLGDRLAHSMSEQAADADALERFLTGPGYPGVAENLPTKDEIHDRTT